jgi:hypothetical protein
MRFRYYHLQQPHLQRYNARILRYACFRSPGSPANVPGPLPRLGLGAAFGFSRRLRRRVRLRSKTSQPS